MQEGDIKPEIIAKAFGQVLRYYRKEKKLSQEKLAQESNLDRTYISLLERGIKQPSLTALLRIANGLEISAAKLVESVVENSKLDK